MPLSIGFGLNLIFSGAFAKRSNLFVWPISRQKKEQTTKMCRRLVKMMHKGSGCGTFFKNTTKSIRLVQRGCANRPFYHIVVAEVKHSFKNQIECIIWYKTLNFFTILSAEISRTKRSGDRTSWLNRCDGQRSKRKSCCTQFRAYPILVG